MPVISGHDKLTQKVWTSLGFMERPNLKKRGGVNVYFKIFICVCHRRMQAYTCQSMYVEVRNNYTVNAGPTWATWVPSKKKYNT